jgi:sugar phosphate isomerase/epimerase
MFQLGIVTYNIARNWDLDTILKKLEDLKYDGVELRTGHKHGVEVTLSKEQRDEVRRKFEDSPVELAGLGSAFEFQSSDPAKVRENIDGARAYVRLAHDVGAPGVKVRPNGLAAGVEPEATFEQIGKALVELGKDAADFGVEIRVEVHGPTTQLLPEFSRIMAFADHPNVGVCWNSNPTDVIDGSIKANFARVAPRIKEVHLRDLTDEAYPWRELFSLLAGINYEGYTLAEIPESPDADRLLRYFRSLWIADQPPMKA